jgi:Haem-binding domain
VKKIYAGVVVLAAILIGCVVAGQNSLHHWPVLPQDGPGADISEVAHPPAPVMATLHRSCYNCHSDHPEVPVYAHIWPSSVLLQQDIHQADARLDFSEWSQLSPEMQRVRAAQVCMMVSQGRMPLWYYKPAHPGSAVSKQEAAAICNWSQSLPMALNSQAAVTGSQGG